MAVYSFILCPHCNSSDVIKNGFSSSGGQRYRCRNNECEAASFMIDHAHPGRTLPVQQKIVEMALNGSGVRDTARVLGVGTQTVINVLKKNR